MRRLRTRAQTSVEYMLVISVVVIALTAAVYKTMYPTLESGSQVFREGQEQVSKDGYDGTSFNGKRR